MIIDTHSHAGLNWYQPVETLLNEMTMHSVAGSVLVQHVGAYDNSYLLQCAQRFPGRFKVVALIDPKDPNPEATLEKLKEQGAAGIRLRANSGYKTRDPYGMWKAAGKLGLVVSVLVPSAATPDEFGADFKMILDACPDTHIQIEHLAAVHREPAPYTKYKRALECAKWPNTSIKVPGLSEVMERPGVLPREFPFTQWTPVYEMALEAFGAKRMTWGSDFPVCAGREGYRNCLDGVRNLPAFRNGNDLEWILGKSAANIWAF